VITAIASALDPTRRLDEEARERSSWCKGGLYANFHEDPDPPYRRVGALLRWQVSRREAPVIREATERPVEVVPLSPEAIAPPASGIRVAWLGHAALYIATPRVSFVVDPLFGAPPFVKRVAPAPIAADRLPRADVLLLTHNHHDHLSPASIAAVRARSPGLRAIVPSGLAGWLRRASGIRETRSAEWWERIDLDGVSVTPVPAHHWSRRGLGDLRRSHWCGFVIEADGRSLYVAGDTASSPHTDAIAARFPPVDAAVLPIGAYSPRWFMRAVHMDPPEAIDAARTLRARVVLPVHWGTLALSDEPLGEPPLYLARAAETTGQPLRIWRVGDVHEV